MDADGLLEFLQARLDEDEQAARAAQDDDGYAEWNNPSTGVVQVAGGDLDGLALAPRAAAIHIARHDPARVLREVEAKRGTLEEYQRWAEAKARHTCAVAELEADIQHQERTGQREGAGLPDVRLRAVRREADYLDAMQPVLFGLVRATAAVYADHPDYKREWGPE